MMELNQNESDTMIETMFSANEVKPKKRRSRKIIRHCCSQCGEPKSYVCLEHSPNLKRKGLSKVWKGIRYQFRKFYFSLAKRLNFVD